MAKKLNEGILNKFVDAFFDSYKKGLDQYFIDKSSEKYPEVSKKLTNITNDLDDLVKYLDKYSKK